jgi:hypothetical protein
MPLGGSHKPTNYPYGAATEGPDDVLLTIETGGDCLYGKASQTLLLGDAVFLSAQDTWNKTNVPANYAGLVGIVVGGFRLDNKIVQDDALIGVAQAAQVNESVIVMVYGVAKVLSDVALATVNTKVTAGSVTAGRVSTTGAASGNFVGGTLVAAAGAGLVIKLAVGMVG